MSPTPVTFASPTKPASWSWEATSGEVAARYGVADAAAESLLSRGLIPRTFPEGHPLAYCLRLTVRNAEQDDRLIEAARGIADAGVGNR